MHSKWQIWLVVSTRRLCPLGRFRFVDWRVQLGHLAGLPSHEPVTTAEIHHKPLKATACALRRRDLLVQLVRDIMLSDYDTSDHRFLFSPAKARSASPAPSRPAPDTTAMSLVSAVAHDTNSSAIMLSPSTKAPITVGILSSWLRVTGFRLNASLGVTEYAVRALDPTTGVLVGQPVHKRYSEFTALRESLLSQMSLAADRGVQVTQCRAVVEAATFPARTWVWEDKNSETVTTQRQIDLDEWLRHVLYGDAKLEHPISSWPAAQNFGFDDLIEGCAKACAATGASELGWVPGQDVRDALEHSRRRTQVIREIMHGPDPVGALCIGRTSIHFS